LRFVAKKAEQKFTAYGFKNQANQRKKQQQSKEGETVIDKMPNQNKTPAVKLRVYRTLIN
jgi:hypothetical protein